jgi:hypothetical protein
MFKKNPKLQIEANIRHIIRGIETFFNPILFAICTRTFNKLCVTYTLTCRRDLSSAPL